MPASIIIAMLRIVEAKGLKLPVKAEQVQRLNEDKDFLPEEAARDFDMLRNRSRSEMGLLKKSDLEGMLWAN